MLRIDQFLFFLVAQCFDCLFSVHCLIECRTLFNINNFFGFVNAGISGATPFQVLSESRFHASGAACVVASIFAEEHIDVVRHQRSICRYA